MGTSAGHRLVLIGLERWRDWCDLRFARIDVDSTHRLTRRVPPAEAWSVRVDDVDATVIDVTGRGDRAFSNGELRFTPAPGDGARLDVTVTVASHAPPLSVTLELPGMMQGHARGTSAD